MQGNYETINFILFIVIHNLDIYQLLDGLMQLFFLRVIMILPPGMIKKDVFNAFHYDQLKLGIAHDKIPGFSYFCKTWKIQFPYLKVVRKNRLGVCDICSQYDHAISKFHSTTQKQLIVKQKLSHIAIVKKGISILPLFNLLLKNKVKKFLERLAQIKRD